MNTLADPLTGAVIGAAIEVHKQLGPGLLESAYRLCLAHELRTRGVRLELEQTLPLVYKGLELDHAYRADMIVDAALIVELKCVDRIERIHIAQTLTYMKMSRIRLGLILNFRSEVLRDGIRRLIL